MLGRNQLKRRIGCVTPDVTLQASPSQGAKYASIVTPGVLDHETCPCFDLRTHIGRRAWIDHHLRSGTVRDGFNLRLDIVLPRRVQSFTTQEERELMTIKRIENIDRFEVQTEDGERLWVTESQEIVDAATLDDPNAEIPGRTSYRTVDHGAVNRISDTEFQTLDGRKARRI